MNRKNRPGLIFRWRLQLRRFFRKFQLPDDGFGLGVSGHPIIHNFPYVGMDGEITINCVITPAARFDANYPVANQQADGGQGWVAPKCVGAMIVEIDDLGLCFRWHPGKPPDELFFASPFAMPGVKPAAKPSQNGGENSHVNPLK